MKPSSPRRRFPSLAVAVLAIAVAFAGAAGVAAAAGPATPGAKSVKAPAPPTPTGRAGNCSGIGVSCLPRASLAPGAIPLGITDDNFPPGGLMPVGWEKLDV